jgi:hypothetical protein
MMCQDGTVKITVFGVSRFGNNDFTVKNNHFDIRYLMAPEIMNLEQKQVGKA